MAAEECSPSVMCLFCGSTSSAMVWKWKLREYLCRRNNDPKSTLQRTKYNHTLANDQGCDYFLTGKDWIAQKMNTQVPPYKGVRNKEVPRSLRDTCTAGSTQANVRITYHLTAICQLPATTGTRPPHVGISWCYVFRWCQCSGVTLNFRPQCIADSLAFASRSTKFQIFSMCSKTMMHNRPQSSQHRSNSMALTTA